MRLIDEGTVLLAGHLRGRSQRTMYFIGAVLAVLGTLILTCESTVPCNHTEYLCDCECIHKRQPCNGNCSNDYYLCGDECKPPYLGCQDKCHTASLVYHLYYEVPTCWPKSQMVQCGMGYVHENEVCLHTCQLCKDGRAAYLEFCRIMDEEIWYCNDSWSGNYDCNGKCISGPTPCVINKVKTCPPGRRYCESGITKDYCLNSIGSCDGKCSGPDFVYCEFCFCCKPITEYYNCNGKCTPRTDPCGGQCYGDDWKCSVTTTCSNVSQYTYCVKTNEPCGDTCLPGKKLCGRMCIHEQEMCGVEVVCLPEEFRCGNHCRLENETINFHPCGYDCIPSTMPCENDCNGLSNLTMLCGKTCVHRDEDLWTCSDDCIRGHEACDGKCRNDSLNACQRGIRIVCQASPCPPCPIEQWLCNNVCIPIGVACRGECYKTNETELKVCGRTCINVDEECTALCPKGDEFQCGKECKKVEEQVNFYDCYGVCLPSAVSCNGSCNNESTDLTKPCGKLCLKENDPVWRCKGECLSVLLACDGKCANRDLALCKVMGMDICQSKTEPCKGKCTPDMHLCAKKCIPKTRHCNGKCSGKDYWLCKNGCQKVSLPCDNKCSDGMIFCDGICTLMSVPCRGMCPPNDYWKCGETCVAMTDQCQGKCHPKRWVCKSKCIKMSEDCDGKCFDKYRFNAKLKVCEVMSSALTLQPSHIITLFVIATFSAISKLGF